MSGRAEQLVLRVTLAARDATTVWQETFDLPAEMPGDALGPLVARVGATFSARLAGDAARRAQRTAPASRADYERIAHAVTLLKLGTRESDEAARAIFEEILERDPHDATANAGVALSWFNEWSCDFWEDFEANGQRAYDYAHRALAIDDRDPWPHLILGRILIYRREFGRGAGYIDRALALAPNNAELLIQIVPALVYLGRPEEADWLLAYNPFRREEDVALVRDGFALLGAAPAPMPPEPREDEARLSRLSPDVWEIVYGEQSVQLPDLKGLHDLAVLLSRPGEVFHCLDLSGRSGEDDTGEAVLDARARAQVKARLRQLQEDLAEAEDLGDIGRAEKLRTEMDRLLEALSSALGLGGRNRRLGDQAERARSAVTWRIRHAIGKIAAAHPELGRHLKNAVKTGTYCSYEPERACHWQIAS